MNQPPKPRVAAIGCGDVAVHRYFPYLAGASSSIEFVACADLDAKRARDQAARFGLLACSPDEAVQDASIDLILNLTPPLAHESINAAALERGKHVYSEKPFALSYADGVELVKLARVKSRCLASAPDTFLGPSVQLARRLIDEGKIGRPYMASMSFVTADRSWHPNPEFFFQRGAGPVFDEGPYFLSVLVALLGSIREVVALADTYRAELALPAGSGGSVQYQPEVPTSYAGVLLFDSGVLASMLLSFDVRGTTMPPLEIYGEEGTLRLAFPGYYNGPVVFGREHDHITEVIEPSWRTAVEEARGLGVEELAHSLTVGEPSRLEGEFPLHILEAMEAIARAASTRLPQRLISSANRPRPYLPTENPRNLPATGGM